MIRQLSDAVQSQLRSGVAITNTTQCIEELVMNALDAKASCIAVRVDLSSYKIQVIDNGHGMSKDQLQHVGERYSTSKCHDVKDLNNLHYFGYRGEAIASIRDTASILEINSRTRQSQQTYCKMFTKGLPLAVTDSPFQRPSIGTTVTVHDLFYAQPVRRKSVNVTLDLEKIRYRVEGIALIHPSVSFTLRNDLTGHLLLQTKKCSNSLMSFTHLFGASKARTLKDVSIDKDVYQVKGYISKEGHANKYLQFVYVNSRLVLKTRIHKILNHFLGKSVILKCKTNTSGEYSEKDHKIASPPKQGDRYAMFVLNVICPSDVYDITFDPAKTLVEFKDWTSLTNAIDVMLMDFLKRENLLFSDFSICSTNSQGHKSEPDNVDSPNNVINNHMTASSERHLSVRHVEERDYTENISTQNSKNLLTSKTVKRSFKHRTDGHNSELTKDNADYCDLEKSWQNMLTDECHIVHNSNDHCETSSCSLSESLTCEQNQESAFHDISSCSSSRSEEISADTNDSSSYNDDETPESTVVSDAGNTNKVERAQTDECAIVESEDPFPSSSVSRNCGKTKRQPLICLPDPPCSPKSLKLGTLNLTSKPPSSGYPLMKNRLGLISKEGYSKSAAKKISERLCIKENKVTNDKLQKFEKPYLQSTKTPPKMNEGVLTEKIASVYTGHITGGQNSRVPMTVDQSAMECSAAITCFHHTSRKRFNPTLVSTSAKFTESVEEDESMVKQPRKSLPSDSVVQMSGLDFEENYPLEEELLADFEYKSYERSSGKFQVTFKDRTQMPVQQDHLPSNRPDFSSICTPFVHKLLEEATSTKCPVDIKLAPRNDEKNMHFKDVSCISAKTVKKNKQDVFNCNPVTSSDNVTNIDIVEDIDNFEEHFACFTPDGTEFVTQTTLSSRRDFSETKMQTDCDRNGFTLTVSEVLLRATSPNVNVSKTNPPAEDLSKGNNDDMSSSDSVETSVLGTRRGFDTISITNPIEESSNKQLEPSFVCTQNSVSVCEDVNALLVSDPEEMTISHVVSGSVESDFTSRSPLKKRSSNYTHTIPDLVVCCINRIDEKLPIEVHTEMNEEEHVNKDGKFHIQEICGKSNNLSEDMQHSQNMVLPVKNEMNSKVFSSDNSEIQVAGECREYRNPLWCRANDPKTGKEVYVNNLTGNNVLEEVCQVSLLTQEQTDSVCSSMGQRTSLTNKERLRLNQLFSCHLDDKDCEDYVKWRQLPASSYVLPDEQNKKDEQSTVRDIFSTWENPIMEFPGKTDIDCGVSHISHASSESHQNLNPTKFTKLMMRSLQVIGQVDNKFIACLLNTDDTNHAKASDLMVLFDQHAAHERVRLEQLTQEMYVDVTSCSLKQSQVSPPKTLILTPDQLTRLKCFRDEFTRIGLTFTVNASSVDSVNIHSIPACLVHREANELNRGRDSVVRDHIETLIEEHLEILQQTGGARKRIPRTIHKVLCSQACHGAIKFGDSLTMIQCRQILDDLADCDLPFQCAHGRPSIIPLLSLHQSILTSHKQKERRPQLWRIAKRLSDHQ